MQIVTSPAPARQQQIRYSEPIARPEHPVEPQTFRVLTSDARTVYLDGPFNGSFGAVIRHAMTCARSVRARHGLRFACCDVHGADGQILYSVSAVAS